MKHFVQYHNSERMGEPCRELNDFSIVTGKAVENLQGSRVWLICGEGTPRRYYLRQTFTVSESGPSESGSFQYFARGEEGQLFDPPLEMDRDDPWFQDFFKRNGRFGFGLQPLRPEDVDQLSKLGGYDVARGQYPRSSVAPGSSLARCTDLRVTVYRRRGAKSHWLYQPKRD